ncbi:hypothetical protein Vi05172_g7088 [Venturia inaequalis]|nr:hypothetical protein Vi05172_g7088 [Venturia inaequalis]
MEQGNCKAHLEMRGPRNTGSVIGRDWEHETVPISADANLTKSGLAWSRVKRNGGCSK